MKKLLYLLLFINFLNANDRIITLSPAINEIAFALGLGDKIIANTEFCDFPIESKNIQKVGGYGSVSLRKIFFRWEIVLCHKTAASRALFVDVTIQ